MVATRRKMNERLENLERELARQSAEIERELARHREEARIRSEEAREEARMRSEEAKRDLEDIRELLRRKHRHHSRGRSTNSKTSARQGSSDSRSVSGSHRSTSSRPIDNHRSWMEKSGRKVDLPLFNGNDAYGWTIKVERFFKLNQIDDEEKVDLVTLAMEGRALNWYHWWEEHSNVRTWDLFKGALLQRFEPGLDQDPYGPLLNLKQTGSVMEYRDEFELVSAPLKNTDVQMLKGIFMKGLKPEVKAELKKNPVRTLTEVMNKALRIEESNSILSSSRYREDDRRGTKGTTTAQPQRWLNENQWKNSLTNQSGSEKSNWEKSNEIGNKGAGIRGTQRLTQSELQELSRKGLCFKCGEKWGKDHICQMKHFQIIMLDDSEEEEEQRDNYPEPVSMMEDNDISKMQLSLLCKEGLTTPRTFKLRGEIQGQMGSKEIVILIDCGATHNFISPKIVQAANLPTLQIPEFEVTIGNGDIIRNNGKCEAVCLNIPQSTITQDFYVLELGENEMVLGLEWLASLGNVEFNFNQLTITWKEKGVVRKLQGDAYSSRHQVPFNSITQKIQASGEGFCLFNSARIESKMEKETANPGMKERLTEIADNKGIIEHQWNPIPVGMDFMNKAVVRVNRLTEQTVENYKEELGKQVAVALYETACCALASIDGEGIMFVAGNIRDKCLLKSFKYDWIHGLDQAEVNSFEKMWEQEQRHHQELQTWGEFYNTRVQYATLPLFLLFLTEKNWKMKSQVPKPKVQNSAMYWEGRGARMKMKWKIKAVSYHPP
ncbi:unnamed protein product [Cuscuta epithymum]|uniref:Ty3 transposon capsid-like protein domain-containing protein n=1 Tax=Cuscuta epithymum TaxID=186058 RepID=A0AAV0DXR6_9ASTE|nr:unnamed protein product [Cuscuta epithymum]